MQIQHNSLKCRQHLNKSIIPSCHNCYCNIHIGINEMCVCAATATRTPLRWRWCMLRLSLEVVVRCLCCMSALTYLLHSTKDNAIELPAHKGRIISTWNTNTRLLAFFLTDWRNWKEFTFEVFCYCLLLLFCFKTEADVLRISE